MDWKAGEGSIRVFAQLRWACPLTLVTDPSISTLLGHRSYEFSRTSELRVCQMTLLSIHTNLLEVGCIFDMHV